MLSHSERWKRSETYWRSFCHSLESGYLELSKSELSEISNDSKTKKVLD